jgi:murein hydrolase activator
MKKIFFLLLMIIFGNTLFSQTIKELEQRKKKTEEELSITSKLLEKTEKEKEQSIGHINVLKRQITLRHRLITDIEKQIELLERELEDKSQVISNYKKDLQNLKKEYAKLIRFAQKNRSEMDVLVFIFASSDFNQAYRRLRFYQQFLRFREKQASEIVQTKNSIEREVESLETTRLNLAKSIQQKTEEVQNLNKEENRFTSTVKTLQQKEKQLRKELEERKKAMDALDKAIADLIAEEARKAAEQKDGKIRDARYLRLSEGFEGNKGSLPWPTSTGIVISEFGEHPHPVLKGVMIRNNGIDISTTSSEKVKAIYEGEVKKIVSIPGQNVAVLIRHGDFLSVYSNLVKVQVKVGDNVRTQQIIGEVYNDEKTGRGIFNLQIWKENKIQNPGVWILP